MTNEKEYSLAAIQDAKKTLKEFDPERNSILQLAAMVQAGEIAGMDAIAFLRNIQVVGKNAENLIAGIVEDELAKYSTAEIKAGVNVGGGFTVTMRSTPGKWYHTDGEILATKKRLKHLEDLGKMSADGTPGIDAETGAEIVASSFKPGQMKIYLNKTK